MLAPTLAEPGQRPHGPHPGLLRRLVGQIAVAGQVMGEAPHRRLQLTDQLAQGVTVAPAGQHRQLLHVSRRNRHREIVRTRRGKVP